MRQFDLDLGWKFKKVNNELLQDFDVKNSPVSLQLNTGKLLRSYFIDQVVWTWASLSVQKGQTNINVQFIWDFDEKNIPVKLEHYQIAISKELHINKAASPSDSSKVQKGQIMVNVKTICDFDVKNIPVKLQYDAYNSWGVITFTR